MKILLAVNETNDAVSTSHYLEQRFGRNQVEVDVLTVIQGSELLNNFDDGSPEGSVEAKQHAIAYDQACALVANVAGELRKSFGIKAVRTHVEYGDPAEVILATSRRWHSSLLLIGAPARRGLLTALRVEGVTRRLLKWADCPVEMLRTPSPAGSYAKKILVPIPVARPDSFILPPLAMLPWQPGSHLHVLGIMPETFDSNQIEANPAATLLAVQTSRDAWAKAKSRLARLCGELAAQLPEGVKLGHQLAEGTLREATVATSQEMDADLVVLGRNWLDSGNSRFAGLSPAALALSVSCSVLMLQDDPAFAGEHAGKNAAGYASLAR
jgi:nucleotide-binding universal stress UspA family protein